MPRVIVGGKVVYLGYLDQAARYLIEEVLRLTGQDFTWDVASESLLVEPSRVSSDPAPAPQVRPAAPSARVDGAPLVTGPSPDLSQVLTGLIDGTITPSAASAAIGRPITVGYGKAALQIRRDGANRPGATGKSPEFDDPVDAMPIRPEAGPSRRHKGQAAGDYGEPWPVAIKPIDDPLGRPSGPADPRARKRPHT